MNRNDTLATLARQLGGDTLRYRVQVEKTLAQEDVRVSVDVTTLATTREASPAELEARIRAALAEFLPVEWVFSRVARQADALGYERLTLRASGRAPAQDCYGLEERARQASRQGLSIERPRVDDSLPNARMTEILHGLRLETLRQVQAQLREIQESTGREWGIGDIEFGIETGPEYERYLNLSSGRYSGKGAYRGSGREELDDDETHALVGAERVQLVSAVTLRVESQP